MEVDRYSTLGQISLTMIFLWAETLTGIRVSELRLWIVPGTLRQPNSQLLGNKTLVLRHQTQRARSGPQVVHLTRL